jgi:hypothetical protein
VCRAEYLSKIFGEKLAEPFGRNCRNRPHLIASIIDHWDYCAQRQALVGDIFCCQ